MIESLSSSHITTPLRLGEELLSLGIITPDQLEVALHEKSRIPTTEMLGSVLVRLGFVSQDTLNDLLSHRSGYQRFDSLNLLVDPSIAARLPYDLSVRYQIIALGAGEDGIWLGMVDPHNVNALDIAREHFPEDLIIPVILTTEDYSHLSNDLYQQKIDLPRLLERLKTGSHNLKTSISAAANTDHPLIRLVNDLLLEAVRTNASDLHFEPEKFFVRIRLRQDGLLTSLATIHYDYWSALSHRLKIMAGMNVANRLLPQDGRFSMAVQGRTVDFRVASLPGLFGENITIRVLDSTREMADLNTLGFSNAQLLQIEQLLAQPEGLVIVTGPTGSGKTTTLYAMLRRLAHVSRNIMTLEDPIEYQVSGLRQTQIKESTGLTFAEGARAILRQDPDVILIGEIRDAETAQIALRAAMTGHLVFTTLHTRDVYGVVPRLLDLGLTHNILSGNLNAIIAQRLVRKSTPDGYQGRTVIGEIFQFNAALNDRLFHPDSTRSDWQKAAREQGYMSLKDHAQEKLQEGVVDIAELNRVLGPGLFDA